MRKEVINLPLRLALNLLAVGIVLSLVGSAAYAYFSDTAASTGNIFSVGTLDLVLSDSTETDAQNVTASFGGTNLAPGACLPPATLWLKNMGSIPAHHAQITAANTNSDLAAYLWLKTATYNQDGLTLSDANHNQRPDLQDLASTGLNNLPLTDLGISHPLTLEICLDGSASNSLQQATNTLDLSVILNQGTN